MTSRVKKLNTILQYFCSYISIKITTYRFIMTIQVITNAEPDNTKLKNG